jgi:hypothetical protein
VSPGFVFWGLFVACAAIVAGFALWIRWIERR